MGTVIGCQFSRSKEGAQQNGYLGLLNRADAGLFRRQIDRVPWDSPEGQRSPGRLDVLQETKLKGTIRNYMDTSVRKEKEYIWILEASPSKYWPVTVLLDLRGNRSCCGAWSRCLFFTRKYLTAWGIGFPPSFP